MAKLYFRYGTVGSAKTLNLLAVAHNYRQQDKRVKIIKPAIDTRFASDMVRSRAGLEMSADIILQPGDTLDAHDWSNVQCVLVDEAQFLTAAQVEALRNLTLDHDVPVLCYGLRTDYLTRLFEGSKRLLELADCIDEVKATCHRCNHKSIVNVRHSEGHIVTDGPTVLLGAEESYAPTCFACYRTWLESNL
jgi:thymidine kinase